MLDIAIIDEQSKPQGNNIYVVYAPDKSKKIATNKERILEINQSIPKVLELKNKVAQLIQ